MTNIRNQLKKLNISKLKMQTGRTVEQELKRHAEILHDCILEEMDNYIYSAYSPKVYMRNFNLYNALRINDMVKVSAKNSSLYVELYFDEDDVMHENFFGDRVDVATILNEGYRTHGRFADVPMLGWRDTTKFIDNGILKYKQRVANPFKVKLNINNEERIF